MNSANQLSTSFPDLPDAARGAESGIAIVVIGRNEGQRLLDCLASLDAGATRIVYVDSGSHDGSPEAACRMNAHVVMLDMRLPFTAARARNAGYGEAMRLWPDVDFIQFVDGDCMVDASWLDSASRYMQAHPRTGIVFGRRRERFPEKSTYNALCDREWSGPPGEARECGGDVFVRVQALHEVGGYDSSLIAGEEPEMCVRLRALGWVIWRLDCEMTLHDANITKMSQWWRRNKRAGHAFAEVAVMHWRSPYGIWKRSLVRSICWGGLLPAAVVVGIFQPAAMTLLALYPVQVARIAARDGFGAGGWRNGTLDVLGKFAELQGAAIWFVNRLTHRRQKIIEYK